LNVERLRHEMDAYYRTIRRDNAQEPEGVRRVRREIEGAMDRYADVHPDCPPVLLKARLHEEIAERFEPLLFRYSPFYYEMGLRPAENWGTPMDRVAGAWLLRRQSGVLHDLPEVRYQEALGVGVGGAAIWNGPTRGFDVDHHCLGYSRVLRGGISGMLAEIAERRERPHTAAQAVHLEAMERSCRALLRIAERFAGKARDMLAEERDPLVRSFLRTVADTAARVPAGPPQTFYEGLAALWFMREVTATLDAVGISVVGHPDRQLIDLYRADRAAGRLTEDEARDLIARWMLPTDVKFHVHDSAWPETSTCMELGGCDEEGRAVWNELTCLFIEVHRDQGFMNPKLNCRYSAASPQAYLDLIGQKLQSGHNHFALLNDDVLIPALVRAGRSERDARLYVNGGCQEPIVEGVEHSAGAYYYFNMPRVLELCLRPDLLPDDGMPPDAWAAIRRDIAPAGGFEAFYGLFMSALKAMIGLGARWRVAVGRHWPAIHPCPLFSATLWDCVEQGLDYTAGGARYNPANVCLVGLGTLVDALYAVRRAVFEERWLTLDRLRACLAVDWAGCEALRQRALRLPRYGHGHAAVDALAARLSREVAAHVRTLPNERGGTFNASFFVYAAFRTFGEVTGATPDGRRAGEPLTMGIAPDHATAPDSPSDVFHTLSRIDFTDHAGNAVLDMQLPLGGGVQADVLSALMRTFARLGGPTLQLSCVSVDDLRDAQVDPGAHRNLVVRICGLSAYFCTLDRALQDEIIERTLYAA
jgi:formate C-acetyltransferase